MKKPKLSVYLEPNLLSQLTVLAGRKEQSKSLIAEAAIAAFLTPDETDKREAVFVRRLDLLARQLERLDRDLSVAIETLALFIRFSLTIAPIVPDNAAAQAKGRERFESFLETLGQRLANGQSLLREVSVDRTREGPIANAPRPAKPQSNKV